MNKQTFNFRKQLLPILKKRFRNDSADVVQRHLDEASTPAGQTLIAYIRQWEFASRNIALGRLLECDRWNDKGELVLERDWKGRAYPFKVPLAMAWEWYCYGDLSEIYVPNSLASRIKLIPENITKDWEDEIKEMFHDINKMSIDTYKTIILGKCVKSYGLGNPHTYAWWDRQLSEVKETQKAIDAFVVTRKGWEYLTTENLQNPKHAREMSKVLCDILAEADAILEPAYKALKLQAQLDNIRRDATLARNDVKGLKKFFQRYGIPEPADLQSLSARIDATESLTLTKERTCASV